MSTYINYILTVLLLTSMPLVSFGKNQSLQNTDAAILRAAMNYIQMIAGDTIEEGPYIIKVLKTNSKCNIRPSNGTLTRYFCIFEIKVTETMERPYSSSYRNCEINFFISNNDLKTLVANENQLEACLEHLSSGD